MGKINDGYAYGNISPYQTWTTPRVSKRVTTREYDKDGNLVKEVIEETMTGGYEYTPYVQPYQMPTITYQSGPDTPPYSVVTN